MPPSPASARDALILSWRDFALKIANWYISRARGALYAHADDVRSAAIEGLVRAAHAYVPSRGVPFPGYARRRIEGAVLDWSRDNDHLSRHFRALAKATGVEGCAPPVALEEILNWQDRFEAAAPAPDDLVAECRAVAAIERAAAALPDRMREVLRLYYNDGLNCKQVGQHFGLTESRICQILKEAHGKLRAALGEPNEPA